MGHDKNEQLTRPGGGRYGFSDICAGDERLFEELIVRGVMPKMTAMAGWEFRGRNLSVVPKLIGIRKFIKGFLAPFPATEEPEEIDGYNLWVRRAHTRTDSWPPVLKNGKPLRHGFFKVYPVNPGHEDNKYPNALLINYSRGENPWHHPAKDMRDYVVQVYEDNTALLVGKAFVPVGPLRIFGSYFVMEKFNKQDPI